MAPEDHTPEGADREAFLAAPEPRRGGGAPSWPEATGPRVVVMASIPKDMEQNIVTCVPIQTLPETKRIKNIQAEFAEFFGKVPEFYVRVPGRVNLIGEHIDYCGYSVCPMALEQDILLAVSVEDDTTLKLHNVDPAFQYFECNISNFEISVGDGAPQWYQYFLCGIRGILEAFPERAGAKGMRVAVGGSVPRSAGLSSSSALVSAAALATAHANRYKPSRENLASLCAECEKYIGTQGGGMDQAIAFLATRGCAKLIHFNPLRSENVILPADASFVIAHSITNLNKAATSDFNQRVVECRMAAQIIAKNEGVDWTTIRRLGDLQKTLKKTLPQMVQLVRNILTREAYSKEEIAEKLGTTKDKLEEISLTKNTRALERFKLRQRALHVFQEALRVESFVETCNNRSESTDALALALLGRLMNDSHDSLRDLYECSHPQLDKLVEISRPYTLGTRLTGAGWGGCAVSLVRRENVDEYVRFLEVNFYGPLGVAENLEDVLFATSPMDGACVYH